MKNESNMELFGYNGRAGAQRHSATSIAAGEDRAPHSRQAALVRAFIEGKGRSGATTDEVRRALLAEKLIHENSVMSARIRELEMAGLIVKTATLRETRAGKMANVYVTQEIFALGGFLRDEVKPAPAKPQPSALVSEALEIAKRSMALATTPPQRAATMRVHDLNTVIKALEQAKGA